jgi:hypothetical protein
MSKPCVNASCIQVCANGYGNLYVPAATLISPVYCEV